MDVFSAANLGDFATVLVALSVMAELLVNGHLKTTFRFFCFLDSFVSRNAFVLRFDRKSQSSGFLARTNGRTHE